MKERITLYDIEELSHITNYEEVVCIRSNNYFDYDLPKFHALLAKCINLEALYFLSAYNLEVFPPEILALKKLHTLVFSGASFPAIPAEISELKALKILGFQSQYISEIPKEIVQLKALEELDLSNSSLLETAEDLEILKEMHSLKHLNLFRIKVEKIPSALPFLEQLHELFIPKTLYNKLKKKHPRFCQQIPYIYSQSELEKKYVIALLNICRKKHFSWNFRAVIFNLLADQKSKLDKLADLETILQITDVQQQEIIRLKALEYLGYRWGALASDSLQEGINIAVIGKLGVNKNELKKKLKEQGIKYSAKITEKTSHVLLGQLPKGAYQAALDRQLPFLTEQLVIAFTDANSEQYLVDDLDDNLQQSEQLSNLLLSGQDENILLALSLFKQGGFPKELLTELFIAGKYSASKEVIREVDRLIRQYGSIALVDEWKKGQDLSSPYTSEVSFSKKLVRWRKTTEIDVLKVAWYSFTNYKKGFLFLLKNLDSKAKVALLQQCIKNEELKLSNLGLRSIPPEIFELKGLKRLDLSYNYQLSSFPQKLLKKLSTLEVIDIRGNSKIKGKALLADLKNNSPQIKLFF